MPSANRELANYCCELMACVGPCVAKRMFGGWGISSGGLTLALMTDLGSGDTLWLKADDETRSRFEQAGCRRFSYLARDQARSMNYYSAPDEAMESPQAMAPWAQLALASALKARAAARPGTRAAKAPTATPARPKTRRVTAPPAKTAARRKSASG